MGSEQMRRPWLTRAGERLTAGRDRRRATRARPLLDAARTPAPAGLEAAQERLPAEQIRPRTEAASPWRLAVIRDVRRQLLDVYTQTRFYGPRQLDPTELDGMAELTDADRVGVAELAVAVRQRGLRLVVTVEPT